MYRTFRLPKLFLFCTGLLAGSAAPVLGRGVVLFVGDGMGVASITASRIHKGALGRVNPPTAAVLNIDRAPRSCLVRTWSADGMVTDSAASITAMMVGEKVPNRVLSARKAADGGVERLTTLLELAEARGLSTGVVTTTRVTHATPAGAYAHVLDRAEEELIALSLLPSVNAALGDGIEVVLGGGGAQFSPAARADGRDLRGEMKAAGYAVVDTAAALDAAVRDKSERLLGLFSPDHMAFAVDRAKAASTEPTLAAMTRSAIETLARNPKGYFLLVEGGRIDHAHHIVSGFRAVNDVLAFDEALGSALTMVAPDDVVFVTADHDHTMVIAGYASVHDDIFTQAGVDAEGTPYTAILYANGPVVAAPRELSAEVLHSGELRERAGVPVAAETHGGMDVPLYVFGPPSILQNIPGVIDNTEIFRLLEAALPQ